MSCPPDDVAPDDDAHTYRSEPVGNSLCVLFLSPLSVFSCVGNSLCVLFLSLLSSCIPLGCRYHYPKEIEAYRNNRSEGVSGRPPVSGRPCVGILMRPVLPMMSPPMMMHTHTGASLSVIACVCSFSYKHLTLPTSYPW